MLGELITRDMGANAFAPLLRNHMETQYPDMPLRMWGDPAGDFKGQNDNTAPFQIFRAHRLPILAAPTFLFTLRLQSIEAVCTRMSEGRPALLISPACTTLVAALLTMGVSTVTIGACAPSMTANERGPK